jgi:MoxR-like ATPase
MSAKTSQAVQQTVSPTRELGVHGWEHLDPLILAALHLEAPLLLVGRHGTAKTLLVEKIAGQLQGQLRHYNASLINYDDLVGIPLPDESGGLRFVGTEGAIWDAEFVFFDEVNRCRPDLQNKMFPIVHERRVAGVDLPRLRHRWAAMNPPAEAGADVDYLGVETLDAALADRFWFVITVPTWKQLTRQQREALVAGHDPDQTVDETAGASDGSEADLSGVLQQVAKQKGQVENTLSGLIVAYVVSLVDLLAGSSIEISPRRAALLRHTIIASYAAAAALGRATTIKDTAELVLLNGLPQWASAERPSHTSIITAHHQAWELAESQADPHLRAILEEPDRVQRIRLALELGANDELVGQCAIGALTEQRCDANKVALATILTETLRAEPLTPAAWSALTQWATPALTPRETTEAIGPGRTMDAWRTATGRHDRRIADERHRRIEAAIIEGCGPDLIVQADLEQLRDDIARYLQMFSNVEASSYRRSQRVRSGA